MSKKSFYIFSLFFIVSLSVCARTYAFWPFSGQAKKAEVPEIAAPLTLSEAYKLALARSEDLGLRHEEIEAAQGKFYQALSGALPHANYQASHFRQDSNEQAGVDGTSGNFLRQTTDEGYFNVTQTLFSGFKEFAAVKAAAASKSQKYNDWRRARQLLFQDVMEAFYTVVQARKDVEVYENTQKLMDARLKELADRVELGRSRDSELYTSTVDAKLITAELEEAKRVEGVWTELLEFYIGKKIENGLTDEENPAKEMKTIDEYLAKLDSRPDVKAAVEGKKAAQQLSWVAKAGLFPTISADANYYNKREGIQKDVDWDVLLKIEVPIFEGTTVIGDIKTAAAEQKSAELLMSRVERTAGMEIRNAYRNYMSMKRQSDLLRDAAAASEENYKTLNKEYSLSLVNNLQVLDALRQYQDVQRRFNQAQYEAKRNFWRFMTAVGEEP